MAARVPDTAAECARSPLTVRHSTTSVPVRRGNWPAVSRPRLPICGCSEKVASRCADALRQISFRYAVDDDQFMTIAKLRAARQLWARVAEVVGEPDAGVARVHAVTSLPMMSQRDPWVNMLRTTLAAFSAGVGAADIGAGATVRRGDPRRLPGNRQRVSGGASPVTPNCCCWRSPMSAGCSIRPAGSLFVEDLTGSWPSRRGRISGRSSGAVGSSRRRATSSPRDRGGAEDRDRGHRAPAHRAHRCERVRQSRRTAATAE